ncbi:hypothetical protein VUR80DRAFT_4196 [Thermomyces stellatus]
MLLVQPYTFFRGLVCHIAMLFSRPGRCVKRNKSSSLVSTEGSTAWFKKDEHTMLLRNLLARNAVDSGRANLFGPLPVGARIRRLTLTDRVTFSSIEAAESTVAPRRHYMMSCRGHVLRDARPVARVPRDAPRQARSATYAVSGIPGPLAKLGWDSSPVFRLAGRMAGGSGGSLTM